MCLVKSPIREDSEGRYWAWRVEEGSLQAINERARVVIKYAIEGERQEWSAGSRCKEKIVRVRMRAVLTLRWVV